MKNLLTDADRDVIKRALRRYAFNIADTSRQGLLLRQTNWEVESSGASFRKEA